MMMAMPLNVMAIFTVDGDSDIDGKIDISDTSTGSALKVTNNNDSGKALEVAGNVEVENNGNLSTVTLKNNNNEGYALDVDGRMDVNINTIGAAVAVTNPNSASIALALDVNGSVDIDRDGNDSTLIIHNDDSEGHALEVDGKAKITINNAAASVDALKIVNENANGGGLNCQCPVNIKSHIKFNDALLNSYIDSADGKILNINTLGSSGSITIGRTSGADTNIMGNLKVKEEINPSGASGSTLSLANSSIGYNVVIGGGQANRSTNVNNVLKCIWGINHPLSGQPVPVGGLSNGVHLAASGSETRVKCTLDVDESAVFNETVTCEDNVTVEGILQVTGNNVDLDTTVDVDCNTAGPGLDVNNASTDQNAVGIKVEGRTALEARGKSAFTDNMHLAADKNLCLDGTTGENYMKYDSTNAHIEFYIGGSLVFYIDENGGHNA
jgi:hypothetical protein